MATSVEFLKRSLLDQAIATPEKVNQLMGQSDTEGKTFVEVIAEANLFQEMDLADLLETYADQERESESGATAEAAVFGWKAVETGYVRATDTWKAMIQQQNDQAKGTFRSLDWYLAREGLIDGEKALDVLDRTSRTVLICGDCGRRDMYLKTAAEGKDNCPDCKGMMSPAADKDDFKVEDAKEYDPLIGKDVGGCRIENLLGKGGMGAVYKARHLALNKAVAVKILASGEMNEAARKRFLREARTAARLEHGNIVQVYNTGMEGENHYIVMQFVDGESVADKLRASGPLPIKEAVRIGLEAAKGIKAAHNLGMIHRDIKPDNIMVDQTGEVKVADFGLAKDLSAESNLTMTAQAMGTPSYMSPEQAEDAAHVDHRSDIYSFGASLYTFLAGGPPFRGSSAWAVVSQHMSADVPDVREVNAEVPETVFELIKHCMSKKPDDRPGDMAEVIEKLIGAQAMILAGITSPPAKDKEPEVTIDVPPDVLRRNEDTSDTFTGIERPPVSEPTPATQPPPEKTPAPAAAPAAAEPEAAPAKKGISPILIGGGVLGVIAVVVVVLAVVLGGNKGTTGGGGGGGDNGGSSGTTNTGGGDNGGGDTGSTGTGSTGTGSTGTGSTGTGSSGAAGALKITVTQPANGSFLAGSDITVSGEVEGGGDLVVLVYNEPAKVSGRRFERKINLGEGPGVILISAYRKGDVASKKQERVDVIVDTVKPKLSLASPKPGKQGLVTCNANALDVAVTMDENYPARVTIAGVEAVKEGKTYKARVPMTEDGKRVLQVKGFDKAGNEAVLSVEVLRDTVPPKITFEAMEETVLGGPGRITVKFQSDEALASVKLGDKVLPPSKDNRYVVEVQLKDGKNTLVASGTDAVGNPAKAEKIVEFVSDLRMSRLKDEKAWQKVLETVATSGNDFDKMAALRGYIKEFPKGGYVLEANKRIIDRKKAGLPAGIVRTFTKGIYLYEKDSVEVVLVEGGTYPNGADDGNRPEQGPAHKVTLSPFFVYRTEVTNTMYAKFLNRTKGATTAPGLRKEGDAWVPVPEKKDEPVTSVSWEEARAYAKAAGGDLPTEAQWEAAARGQGSGPYPWGAAPPSKENLNCRGLGGGALVKTGTMAQGAAAVGALDMAGNAAEWCRDFFVADAYKKRKAGVKDPWYEALSHSRVIRGGGYISPPAMCTVTARFGLDPNTRMGWIGFRVVLPGK